MPTFKTIITLTTVLSLASLLGACSSKPLAAPPVVSPPVAVVTPAPQVQRPQVAATSSTAPAAAAPMAAALPAYLDPKNPLQSERSVYFDFDQSLIKVESKPLIELHSKYLAGHPALAIRIEGNSDERGGAEYNLALGQKRAEAVRQALKAYGVKDAQMEAISWGKEKPKAAGHDETSWAQNRRADMQYPTH